MTIRWALVGPGRHAARSVVAEMQKAAGAELAAIVSRDPARGPAFAAAHDIAKTYNSFEDVLRDGDIDAIYDATPDGLHAQHAIAAARAGKHALVEKPLATSVRDCEDAIAAARRYGVTLGVVFNQRHEAVHQEARRLVQEGAIGDVRLVHVQIALGSLVPRAPAASSNWRADRTMRAGGIVVSIADHAYDTMCLLVGQTIEEITAFTDQSAAGPPDERIASMLFRLSGGALGYAAVSFATPFARRPFEIHGTKGSLVIENSYVYLTGAGADPTPTLTLTGEAGSTVKRFAPTEVFRLEIEQFGRAIAGDGAPMTPGEDGLRAVRTGAAIYAAVRSGRVVKLADFQP